MIPIFPNPNDLMHPFLLCFHERRGASSMMDATWNPRTETGKHTRFHAEITRRKDFSKKVYGGMTPLCLAISSGNVDAAEMILDSNVDVGINKTNLNGHTAPTRVCIQGCVHLVEKIVHRGANIDNITNGGLSPIFHAIENSLPSLESYLTIVPSYLPLFIFSMSPFVALECPMTTNALSFVFLIDWKEVSPFVPPNTFFHAT